MSVEIMVAALLSLLFGIVSCFSGYRFFRLMLAIWGVVIGATLGFNIITDNETVRLLAAFAGAILGGVAFYYLYYVGAAIMGAYLLTIPFLLLLQLLNVENVPQWTLVIPLVIGGVLGLFYSKYLIILGTAMSGASLIINAGLILFSGVLPTFTPLPGRIIDLSYYTGNTLALILWLVLVLAGFSVQYATERDRELRGETLTTRSAL